MGSPLPVPLITLGIGKIVVILLIAGVAIGCYMHQMGKTFKIITGTVKKVTEKPLSGCHFLFSRMFKCTQPVTSPHTTQQERTIEDVPKAKSAEIHPVQMMKILRDVFQDPQTAHKYTKNLDKKVQAGPSASLEPKITPREYGGYSVLEAPFQTLTDKTITPSRATPGSVGYDVYTPIYFILQPQEQKTIFIDIEPP